LGDGVRIVVGADVRGKRGDEPCGEHRADDGDAEGAAEFAGGGLQPGSDPGLGRR
jgi:hypothetical protein